MSKVRVLYLLAMIICLSLPSFAQESIMVKVINADGEPILGVDVIQGGELYRLGNTNKEGYIPLQVSDSKSSTMIIFSRLGYIKKSIALGDLKMNSEIILDEKAYEIEAIVVRSLPDLKKLTESLYKLHKKRYRAKDFHSRYYGYAHYAKVIESRGKSVSKRREYGLFLTSGNCKKVEHWDVQYSTNFMPKYAANSFELTSDGKAKLKNLNLKASNNRSYNAGVKKIDLVMRQIYVYGPIFSDPSHFTFKHLNVEGDIHTISFQTKPSSYPKKSKCLSVGDMKVNIKTGKIAEITFSFFDYSFPNIKWQRERKFPFKTEAQVKIEYDFEGHAYISQAYCSTIWNHIEDENNIILGEAYPSRPFASKNKLVEKEFWRCDSYKVIPQHLKNKETTVQARYAKPIPGVYNEEFFKNKTYPISSADNFQQLNDYLSLEEQYKSNVDSIYRFDQLPEKSFLARKIILEKFNKLDK